MYGYIQTHIVICLFIHPTFFASFLFIMIKNVHAYFSDHLTEPKSELVTKLSSLSHSWYVAEPEFEVKLHLFCGVFV